MFQEYNPLKARHSYGPQGHRGMSAVIFADSPAGYYSAERLVKNFMDARKGRQHWDQPSKSILHPGGDRILYGYMAAAEDSEIFNRHSTGEPHVLLELPQMAWLFSSLPFNVYLNIVLRRQIEAQVGS